MSGKLNVAFLWHMHQPYYRDPKNGKYILPWVRLHGLKGYSDMLAAIQKFGDVRVTFNFVPALLAQLDDLSSGRESDTYYDISLKPAEDLEPAEKKIMLKYFFSASWANMVMVHPRYRDLLNKRGRKMVESDIEDLSKRFTVQDFRDLQVWFNLAWIGWSAEDRYPIIGELKRKDRNFIEEDKRQLLDLQLQVLKDIIPNYRAAWDQGNIEISTTPFYHPILPLLVDNRSARISQPGDPMPGHSFLRPQDAREQLQRGLETAKQHFGRAPLGLWPSEGSVSPAVCELAGDTGFKWIATDENVLLATLNDVRREDSIYSSYLASIDGLTLFFRDHDLSDAVGFRYARNAPKRSADDLLGNLLNIAKSRPTPEESIVAIILDGENAWEYFPDGGKKFFEELYTQLTNHSLLQMCTFSEFAEKHPAKKILPPIFPASWINGSFRIWIGDPVKNLAWDRLGETAAFLDRQTAVATDTKVLEDAREHLYIAEGSDWFWWYGEPNHSVFEEEFDYLFRSNLIQIYREFGVEPPANLLEPIRVGGSRTSDSALFTIDPVIDGKETFFYEWIGAQEIDSDDFSGAMNLVSSVIDRLFFGFTESHFCLRLDPTNAFRTMVDLRVEVQFNKGAGLIHAIELTSFNSGEVKIDAKEGKSAGDIQAAFDHVLELKIPFNTLPHDEDSVPFSVRILQGNLELEKWPREGFYKCPQPTPEYLSENWII
ncbi:MAG: glycoside hydrolase family 57 protein [bacterium]|nr:glycoside hydrolase family 57 protein [bacterium]